MPSKTGKRPVDGARSRLTEKLHSVRSKTQKLFELITELSNEAIKNAESALKETSKTMFLHKYTKSSQELERCLNKLLLITDITTSGDDEDEDSTTKPSPTLSSGVLSKHASQESLFSSGFIQPFAALDGRQQLSFTYFYIPPEVAYSPPHNVNKEAVVCDLFITTTESKGDWWKLNYYKPPIQNHLGFIMAVEEIAVYLGIFKSELNTKKSQRILKESLEISLPKDNRDTIPKLDGSRLPYHKRNVLHTCFNV